MPPRKLAFFGVMGLVGFGLAGARSSGPPGSIFGTPLPGLSPAELERFQLGKVAFEEVEGLADGLGPVFTENSCAKCHAIPAVGGGSEIVETRIGTRMGGVFDPLVAFGGPIIQDKGIGPVDGPDGQYDYRGETIPDEATIHAGRRSTPLFDLGLVGAVPDRTFHQIAHYQQAYSPDTAGRPHIVTNLVTNGPAVGRFGWKAQLATLFDFAGDAYTTEMGITTPLVPVENCPQGDCEALRHNPLPSEDPNEEDNLDLVLFSDFMALLSPPPRQRVTGQARVGEMLFAQVGCASCHLPTLRTGLHPVRSLSYVTFHPFSDFLLHDMGGLGDGIGQGDATGGEMRTAPLWGVSAQTSFLHDGRARTLEAAILAHDGQGRSARDRFANLHGQPKRALLAFLNSL